MVNSFGFTSNLDDLGTAPLSVFRSNIQSDFLTVWKVAAYTLGFHLGKVR